MAQCELHFDFQASAFPSYRANIAFFISYLSGQTKAWATTDWDLYSAICYSLPLFIKTLILILKTVTPDHKAARALVNLCQGKEFRTLAAESQP